jgi:hypothetical protein
MNLLPQSLLPPGAEVVVDGLPGRQVMGQQPPGAAGPQPVGHSVDQLAAVMDGRAATRLGRRDERGREPPLGVGEVGGDSGGRAEVMGGFLVVDGITTAANPTGLSDTLYFIRQQPWTDGAIVRPARGLGGTRPGADGDRQHGAAPSQDPAGTASSLLG